MNIAVITLARRHDRLTAFQQRWHTAVGDIPVRPFFAVDLPQDPSLGCLASHVQLLGRADPDTPLLVFEDDAVFTDDFTLDWPDPPPDWQLLRLGGRYIGQAVPVTRGWVRLTHVVHTHAYVARRPQAVAAAMFTSGATNAVNALAGVREGHYAQSRQTVGQAAGGSDIRPGTRGSDEFWHRHQ